LYSYVEAKTGHEQNVDKLPCYYFEVLDELQEEIDRLSVNVAAAEIKL
jgi:hypothetical protein